MLVLVRMMITGNLATAPRPIDLVHEDTSQVTHLVTKRPSTCVPSDPGAMQGSLGVAYYFPFLVELMEKLNT